MGKIYIGISGKMGVGKTTVTNGIQKVLKNSDIEVVSLAKPIKDIQNLIYSSLDMNMKGVKDRSLLIALGMWGRGKDDNFWLDQAVKRFTEATSDIVICDDVRFENEAEWFKNNGILIRLEGDQSGGNVDESDKDSPTETALDSYEFDNVVSNTSGIIPTLLQVMHIISTELDFNKELKMEVINGREKKENIIRAD